MATKPLIVIVGPTASGKTATAIKIALKYGGEIICADSRTIYQEMDVGTAKPSDHERSLVPHHGLDLVRPDQRFSVADFKQYADQTIADIRARGNVPILVGGTGLYIDSVVFNFQFNQGRDSTWRAKPRQNTLVVGIATSKSVLRERIEQRAEQLFANGVVDEATMLGKKYGWDVPSMTGNIYPIAREHQAGDTSRYEAIEKFVTSDWRLAKRQMTWFRPNPYIEWCTLDDVDTIVSQVIVSE